MNRWIKLILAIICIGLPFNGYCHADLPGRTPCTGSGPVGTLFIDGPETPDRGSRLCNPAVRSWVLAYGNLLMAVASGNLNSAMIQNWTPNLIFVGFDLCYRNYHCSHSTCPPPYGLPGPAALLKQFNSAQSSGRSGNRLDQLHHRLILISLVIGIPILHHHLWHDRNRGDRDLISGEALQQSLVDPCAGAGNLVLAHSLGCSRPGI